MGLPKTGFSKNWGFLNLGFSCFSRCCDKKSCGNRNETPSDPVIIDRWVAILIVLVAPPSGLAPFSLTRRRCRRRCATTMEGSVCVHSEGPASRLASSPPSLVREGDSGHLARLRCTYSLTQVGGFRSQCCQMGDFVNEMHFLTG